MADGLLAGAASIPSAPLLVPGVGIGGGDAVEQVRGAVARVVSRLPDTDVTILMAAGQAAIHDTVAVNLAGLGYPHITHTLEPCAPAIVALSRVTQYPRIRQPRLPLDLGVLALLVDRSPVVALEVPSSAEFAVLSALGTSIVQALEEAALTGTLVAAGDLSAGLRASSPLAVRPGAQEWDDRVVHTFTGGRAAVLADLGPLRALEVGARGWAPLCVLHGAVASAPLSLTVRRYSAPRGVGYLVAST